MRKKRIKVLICLLVVALTLLMLLYGVDVALAFNVFGETAHFFPAWTVKIFLDSSRAQNMSAHKKKNVLLALDESYSDLRYFEPAIGQILRSDKELMLIGIRIYSNQKLDPPNWFRLRLIDILRDQSQYSVDRMLAIHTLTLIYDMKPDENEDLKLLLKKAAKDVGYSASDTSSIDRVSAP